MPISSYTHTHNQHSSPVPSLNSLTLTVEAIKNGIKNERKNKGNSERPSSSSLIFPVLYDPSPFYKAAFIFPIVKTQLLLETNESRWSSLIEKGERKGKKKNNFSLRERNDLR